MSAVNFKLRRLIPNWLVNIGKHWPEAVVANIRYGFPARKLRVVGVTGTDGKTTTVNMIYRILKDAGRKVSMFSTINAEIAGYVYDTGFHVTTPQAHKIQQYLKLSTIHGDDLFVMEVTSHALSQFRVWGIDFEVGVITNLSYEHLDYYKNFEDYLNTKTQLVRKAKWAVLNYDDPNFQTLVSCLPNGKIITFGLSAKADINPKKFPLKLNLPGEFNVLNGLAAVAVGRILGVDDQQIKKTLSEFKGLKGRMELVENDLGIKIIVDFAHTPKALEQALKTLRKQLKGKIIAVFGAAAERDESKRPMMGEIAVKLANTVVLTDEDPRFEDRMKIIEEVSRGAYTAGARDGVNLFKEKDRRKAIKMAIEMAKVGDIVAIFGKGHERSMNYQGLELPWSDKGAVLEILEKI